MKRALWAVVAALVVLVIMNINLAMELGDLRSDLAEAEPAIEAEAANAEKRLAQALKEAEASTDIGAIKDDMDALERAVFGKGGPEADAADAFGELQDSVAALEEEISDLADCFNGALDASLESFANNTVYNVFTC